MMNRLNIRRGMALSPALWLVTAVAFSVVTPSVMARHGDQKPHRGYVDGSAFAELATGDETLIEVSISGALLKMVAAALGQENEAIGSFLDGIVSINAVVIEDAEDGDDSAARMAAGLVRDLKKDGWDQVAHVREPDEEVTVLVLLDDKHEGSLSGITVMVCDSEGNNIVFANIAGRIDLSIAGKVAQGLSIPGLEQLANFDLGDAIKKSKGKKHDRE